MFNNKRGFTLAEVLVTLGIIGVVAVLTVPNVISSYQKKVYVAQLQKAYNQISNALALLMVDEEVDNLNDSSLYCSETEDSEACYERMQNFLNKYFKVTKDCGHDDDRFGCISEIYKYIDGDIVDMHNSGLGVRSNITLYCVNTNSSATYCFTSFTTMFPLKVFVDINGGHKTPNTWGRDAFALSVNFNGEIAESFQGYPYHLDPEQCYFKVYPERCLQSEEYGVGCFTKIINDGWKMDY